MFTGSVTNAATDVPQLMLEESIYPTFLHFVYQTRHDRLADSKDASNAVVGYGDGLNWPMPEPFNITLKRANRLGVSEPDEPAADAPEAPPQRIAARRVEAQAEDAPAADRRFADRLAAKIKAASMQAADIQQPNVQAADAQGIASQVVVAQAIAKQAIALAMEAIAMKNASVAEAGCSKSDKEPTPESFLLASAFAPVSRQPDLPHTATRSSLPQPIERFTFFPSFRGFSLSMGIDYSTGKYGGPHQVDTVVIPLSVKYEASRWAVKLTIPRIEVIEKQTIVDWWGDTISYRAVNSGLGDIGAAVTYYAYDNQDFTAGLDVTGKVKFGTAAREKGLGNGQNDYAAQINGYWSMGDVTASGAVGYKIPGQPPGVKLHNVFNESLGAGYKFNQSIRLGFSMDQRQKSSEWGARQREISAYLSYGFSKNWNIQGYIMKGLADGSPDVGGGATLMVSLN